MHRGSVISLSLGAAFLTAPEAAPAQGPSPACQEFADGFEVQRTPVVVVTQGGYRISIDRHQIVIRDPPARNRVEHWGTAHENLNGLHIKDWGGAPGWDGARRTLELGDGSKVTMVAHAAQGVVVTTSIYDGARNVQVANCRNAVTHHGNDALDTAEREQAQFDGEISSFATNPATGAATYQTRGNENPAFDFLATPQVLGTTGGTANPNQVDDFFDDPRLGHT